MLMIVLYWRTFRAISARATKMAGAARRRKSIEVSYLRRDARLARYMLSSWCVCLSVCPSVRHKRAFYRNG